MTEPIRDPAWDHVLNLADVESLARERCSPMAYEYVASGAADELTAEWNQAAYRRIRLMPRVLVDVTTVRTELELLGTRLPHPVVLAPTAYHRVVHPEGEEAVARGAADAGALWVVSTNTNTAIEAIRAAAPDGARWFQLYLQSDREYTRELVERVTEAGCGALCLTVDTPALGVRDRQRRAGFELPPGVDTPHLYDVNSGKRQIMSPGRVVATWGDVEWLLGVARVPVVLKGVLNPDDADRAVRSGVAGLIVSNHGGRNLDTLPATVEALPRVVERVAGRVPVLVDGGVRRGTDVLKAMALGAAAVLIGRPYLYGLAAGGAAGVRRVVEMLRDELALAMALSGRPALEDLDGSVIWPEP